MTQQSGIPFTQQNNNILYMNKLIYKGVIWHLLTTIITYPLDITKTRKQTDYMKTNETMTEMLHRIYIKESHELTDGLNLTCVWTSIQGILTITMCEKLKCMYIKQNDNERQILTQ